MTGTSVPLTAAQKTEKKWLQKKEKGISNDIVAIDFFVYHLRFCDCGWNLIEWMFCCNEYSVASNTQSWSPTLSLCLSISLAFSFSMCPCIWKRIWCCKQHQAAVTHSVLSSSVSVSLYHRYGMFCRNQSKRILQAAHKFLHKFLPAVWKILPST